MIELFAAAAPQVARTLIERTASTPGVLQMLQFSLAPAFLLVGIGSVMNVMVQRLTWVANRIERLEARADEREEAPCSDELDWLLARRRIAQNAVMFSTGAAALISVLIALLFASAYVEVRIGTLIAGCWVATMLLLITGLAFFFAETRLATKGPRSRQRRSGNSRR
jgi:predicted membrane-bound dolichyl-phosphate-mannose-protein mannosyltransferase